MTPLDTWTSFTDAAFCEYVQGESGVAKVFNDTSTQKNVVSNCVTYANLEIGDYIEGQGYAGGRVYGQIEVKGSVYNQATVLNMYNQVCFYDPCVQGDSGGPAYEKTWNSGDQAWGCHPAGIIWGYNDDYTIFSPMEYVDNDMGMTFDFDP
jgi:hypothetical protein